jgi:hypothetical protein
VPQDAPVAHETRGTKRRIDGGLAFAHIDGELLLHEAPLEREDLPIGRGHPRARAVQHEELPRHRGNGNGDAVFPEELAAETNHVR